MKITATQYAKALYGSVENKSSQEIDVLVVNFVKLLQKNSQMQLAGKIIENFATLYNSDKGIIEASVISAKALSAELLKGVEDFVIKKYGAKQVILKNTVDSTIKGGIILQVGDELLDTSVIRKMSELKNKLAQ